jgi:hypothetical protein
MAALIGTGIPAFTKFAYPSGRDNTQRRQRVDGTMTIGPAAQSKVIAISAWSITSNVITLTTATQSPTLTSGTIVTLAGFGTTTTLNGVQLTVSATGLTTTQFEAPYTAANASATEAGSYSLTPTYITGGLPTTWLSITDLATTDTQPLYGSVFIRGIAGIGYVYQWDYVNSKIRIVSSGTEVSTGAGLAADTVVFTAEFDRT